MLRALYRKSIPSALKRSPKPLEPEQTQAYLAQARQGDLEAIEALILGHVGMVAAIATRFAAQFPHKAEDIFGEALSQLVEKTHRIAKGELMKGHDEYDPYLVKSISRDLRRWISEDHVVTIRQETKLYQAMLKESPENLLLMLLPSELQEQNAASPKITDTMEFLLQEVAESSLLTTREKWIVGFRMQGLTDAEIGVILNFRQQTIAKTRKEMQPRLEMILGVKA